MARMEEENDVVVIQKVMDVAQRQFKEQNYTDCLKLFSRAISYARSMDQETIAEVRKSYGLKERPSYLKETHMMHHPKLVSMLDCRAAVLEKLNKLEDALEDATMMVRVEPFNAKGYLRSGKILQKMEDMKKALKSYEEGLTMLKVGRHQFKLKLNESMYKILKDQKTILKNKIVYDLEQTHTIKENSTLASVLFITETTQGKAAAEGPKRKKHKADSTEPPQKPLDPLDYLPLEIIHRILSLMPLKYALRCRQISRNWNSLVPELPLFNDICMCPYVTVKDVSNCFQVLERSKKGSVHKKIQRLHIPSMSVNGERGILSQILQKSKVMITDTLDLTFMDITMQELVESFRLSDNVKSVLSHLKHLRLTCVFVPRYEEQLLEYLPFLQSITVVPAPTRKASALPKSYTASASIYPELRDLTIIGDLKKRYPSVPFEHFFTTTASGQLPNLRSLVVVGYDFSKLNSMNGTFNFLQSFPELHTLVFENNRSLALSTLLKSHDVVRLSKLTKFVFREPEVRNIEGLQVYELDYLRNIFGHLQVLDLTGSSISYPGLIKLLSVCGGSLKHLSIGFCSNIVFKRGRFTRDELLGQYFNFDSVAKLCPNLESFYLNQSMEFGDYSLTEMTQAITLKNGFPKLRLLDLSFNNLSGYKILELVKAKKLHNLILHGVNIQPETIKVIEKVYCKRLESRLDKQYWREYGINSWNPF
jgi:protein DIA2